MADALSLGGFPQPMLCLCGARKCRGFIGGNDTDASRLAAALADGASPAPDASADPEPLMVGEAEAADPALAAILDEEVGLAPCAWGPAALQRYVQLVPL